MLFTFLCNHSQFDLIDTKSSLYINTQKFGYLIKSLYRTFSRFGCLSSFLSTPFPHSPPHNPSPSPPTAPYCRIRLKGSTKSKRTFLSLTMRFVPMFRDGVLMMFSLLLCGRYWIRTSDLPDVNGTLSTS